MYILLWRTWQIQFQKNVVPNRLEKYLSFSLDNDLVFIESFLFFIWKFLLDSLVKNSLYKNDFKHFSQEFDIEVLDLVKQKEFYPYEYNSSFEKFWKTLSGKNEFYIWSSGKRIIDKEYQ